MLKDLKDKVLDACERLDATQVCLRLTLVILLIYGAYYWYGFVPLAILGIGGLVFQQLMNRAGFWFAIVAVLLATAIYRWPDAGNPIFALAYWCGAIGITRTLPVDKQDHALKFNARILVGLWMAIAVLLKIISGTFIDSSFLHFSLIANDAFADFTAMVGGVDFQTLDSNRATVSQLQQSYASGSVENFAVLETSPRIKTMAYAMSWWTIFIEGAIAVSFLWPSSSRRAENIRHLCMLVFLLTTYFVIHATGYALILITLSFILLPPERRGLRLLYVNAFVFVELFRIPFEHAVMRIMS